MSIKTEYVHLDGKKNGKDTPLPKKEEPKTFVPRTVHQVLTVPEGLDHQIKKINRLKKHASAMHDRAKEHLKKIISQIMTGNGKFDYSETKKTVDELFDFIVENETAFAYLTKDIFTHEEYLLNHSINVCTIGIAVLKRYNDYFSRLISKKIIKTANVKDDELFLHPYYPHYNNEELKQIATGYLLHDIGKLLIPEEIVQKKGKLSDDEFNVMKSHSFSKGKEIFEKNGIDNPFITNPALYHHAAMFGDDQRCYPADISYESVKDYVKICKLADIYDAMTSKRVYKEAFNPVWVVSDLFRNFAGKDPLLQLILHSFVKVVGIYPPGSIVHLINNQLAYVIDSKGPILLPFTDDKGVTLKSRPDPIILKNGILANNMSIDNKKALMSPALVFQHLPEYLKEAATA